ncbi:MAG: sugar O-acetyltransferase, partial [Hominenteromicrobium sp.]
MTMRERIRQGKLFTDMCEGMPEERMRAKKLMKQFNDSEPDDPGTRMALLEQIFGKPAEAWIEPPIYFCYGSHITLGKGCYINVNCNFIDDGEIRIGNAVMFGPAVTIATVGHPIHPELRGYMYCAPVSIGDNCWIGGGSVICPGVTIGENTVIGAG